MTEYRLFIQNEYDRACGYYHTYGISVFEDGRLTRIIKDVSLEREKVERLINAFNDGELDSAHLNQAVEEFLLDFEM